MTMKNTKARLNWSLILTWLCLIIFWFVVAFSLRISGNTQSRIKAGQVEQFPIVFGDGLMTAGNWVFVDDAVVPFYSFGQGPPAPPCHVGRDFYLDTSAGRLYICPSPTAWKAVN
jgi:hypothetical protein